MKLEKCYTGKFYYKFEKQSDYTSKGGKDVFVKQILNLGFTKLVKRVVRTGYTPECITLCKNIFPHIVDEGLNILIYGDDHKRWGDLTRFMFGIVNEFKSIFPGIYYDHINNNYIGCQRGFAQRFKIGDKLFEESFKGDYTEEQLEKLPFIQRGTKTIVTLDECLQAAKNFVEYLS